MNWYYAHEGTRSGPVSDTEFQELVLTGVITPDTLVWNENLSEWVRYAELTPDSAPIPSESPSSSIHFTPSTPSGTRCSECGKIFDKDDMLQLRGAWVCAACKPIVIQKLKEGLSVSTEVEYAGFGIRFVAKLIDGILLWTMQFLLVFLLGSIRGASVMVLINTVSMVLSLIYTTFFLGRFGATPGKIVCRLQVITSDGENVTYARAFGRYWAEILSSLILGIGYLMAAFDEEHRTLHDRICDTRVIKAYS